MVPEIIMRIVQGRGTNGSVLHGMDWPAADRKRGGDVIAVPAGAQVLGSRRLSARPIVLEGPSL